MASSSITDAPPILRVRSRAALVAGRAAAGASKLARLGTGSVIGGKLALALDPALLRELAAGREIAVVSGTNGKTTTTHLLAAALGTIGPVATNALGANMPPGLVAALDADRHAPLAALEVDERWVPKVLDQIGPATVLLLNLSRDQLDRSHEVRKIADTWHDALSRTPVTRVVANADDPLVTWAAHGVTDAGGDVVWVAAGGSWTLDAAGCPACGGRITFTDTGWHCRSCAFGRPEADWRLETTASAEPRSPGFVAVREADRTHWPLALALPGRVNAGNALMVLAATSAMGADPGIAIAAMSQVAAVAGRYKVATIGEASVRMLLAKNPAGWQEALELVEPPPTPCIAAINARIADGRDPSWLWDVPFERLRGRLVVATGERRHDLAVRLAYADVDHVVADSLGTAVRAAGDTRIDLIANYTAFQDYLDEVGRDD
jgi:UDP-N-acetylmuramyl tripeptide synthase